MRAWLFLGCLWAGLFIGSLSATPADPAALCREALTLTFPNNTQLSAYDALGRLATDLSTSTDWACVFAAQEEGLLDRTQSQGVDTLKVLLHAYNFDRAGYTTALAAFQKSSASATFRKLADTQDLLEPCPTCKGSLRCPTCKGALKCPACKGSGTTLRRPKAGSKGLGADFSLNSSSANSMRIPCPTCKGSAKCPTCKGRKNHCETCGNTGKVPNQARLNERMSRLVKQLQENLATQWQADLSAREQTARLAEDLRHLQGLSRPEEALAYLNTLPPERTAAVQWAQIGPLRAALEATIAEATENSTQKQTQRANLRAAIARAQQRHDPLQGLTELVPLFTQYADCDALPEAQTAFDGLLSAAQRQQVLQVEALQARIQTLANLKDPAEQLDQAERCLAEWPAHEVPPALLAFARQTGHETLLRCLTQDAFGDARQQLDACMEKAQAALQKAQNAGLAWWVWAIIAIAALLGLYVLWATIASLAAKRAETARQARQKAALANIRKTFSRHHK